MKKFLLYGHGGAYNHGAEAIVKTTAALIRRKYADAYIALSSHFTEQDRAFSLDADQIFAPGAEAWAQEKTAPASEKIQLAHDMYADALSYIDADTILLSVGGDNYCYNNWHRLAVFQEKATTVGAKSLLWSCSVEPSVITPEMVRVLNSHTHILARESLTSSSIAHSGVTADVCLLPDVAFALEPKITALPAGFACGNFVCLNISPLITRRESATGIMVENALQLIHFLLSETDLRIALVPHVEMPADNDFELLSEIYQILPESERQRVWLVANGYSAAQYKFIVSQCFALVCARTHASIAAYSSSVPCLVAGYSVKSAGIAADLGQSEFVVDTSEITQKDTLKTIFTRLYDRADEVRTVLSKCMPEYKAGVDDYLRYL